MSQPTLTTARLLLRPVIASDAAAIVSLLGDPAIAATTLAIPHPYEVAHAEQWIAGSTQGFADGRLANFAVVARDTGILLGATGLVLALPHHRAELGYWIGKPHWGRGYCTEACRGLLRFAFAELRLRRVHAACFTGNTASERVLLKLGFVHEGRLRQHVVKSGRTCDLDQYGMLSDEWRDG